MSNTRQLASRIAMAAAVTAMVGTSAFAESRPAKETLKRSAGTNIVRSGARVEVRATDRSGERSTRVTGRTSARAAERQRTQRRERVERAEPRERVQAREQSGRRERDGRRYDSRRERDGRRYDSRRYNDHRGNRYGNRKPYHARGRVSRVVRYGGGYRVWIGGAPYPFFVPAAHYHRDRFRVGLFINLGGYYNPAGYYDYYDYRTAYSRAELRGVVESVDYRRDTFVIRNEATGSFVTVVMRDRRRDVRPGDFVEMYGDWSRSGLFQAYDVDLLDYRRY